MREGKYVCAKENTDAQGRRVLMTTDENSQT